MKLQTIKPNNLCARFLIPFLFIQVSLFAQTKISGTIKDINNESLIGATVLEKGTNTGVVTDLNGEFTLNVSDPQATLVISFIGYLTEEYDLKGQSKIEVILVPNITGLDEVVVIGYGTQSKRDITGSVVSIDSKRFEDIPATNLTGMLQGSVPGMSINTFSGEPGSSSDILIRGVKSINGSNNPLIVIDGILGASIDDIHPDNIENIQVLKDAAASSIYGSRASGGVIIITTKSGRKGKVNVSYNGYYGRSYLANKVDVYTADEYVAKKREIYRIKNTPASAESLMSYEDAQAIPIEEILAGNELEMYELGKSYNWLNEVTQDAPIQGHNLRISGGDDKTTYMLAVSTIHQTGIIQTSDLGRRSVRANVSSKFANWIEAGTNILVSKSTENDASDIFAYTYQLSPLGKKYEDEVNPGEYSLAPMYPDEYIANPFTELQIDRKRESIKLLNSTFVELTPMNGLTYRVSFNTVLDNRKYNDFVPQRTRLVQAFLQYENATIEYQDHVTYNFDNLLSYHKSFGQHRLTGTLVYSTEEYQRDRLWAYGENFGTDYYTWTALSTSQPDSRGLDSDEERWFLESYLGRFNYSFNDRYLIQLSARNDRSSKFSKENRDAFFPSASFGWIISDESFMNNVSVLNNLKLRMSWAKTGNQAIDYHDRFNTGEVIYYTTGQDGLGSIVNGLVQTTLANKDLKWEVSTENNIGLDFTFFNYRLSGNIELYKSVTTDLIWNTNIPTTTGFSTITDNVGSLENKGVEFSLNGTIIKASEFTLGASATFTANRNKILDLDGTKTDDVANRLFIGEPIGAIYDYVFDGILQEGEEAPAHMPDLETGMVKVKDIAGFIELEDASTERVYEPDSTINEADQQIIGQVHPKWYGSFGMNVSYKNFELSAFINHVQGVTRRIPIDVNARPQSMDIPYYTDENPNNQYGRPGITDQYNYLSYYVDASYTRLQDVTLAYRLSNNFLNKAGIGGVRIYISGQNLLTFTDYIGFDPAVSFVNSSGNSTNQTSADIAKLDGYPTVKNFIVGLNVTF